MPTLDARPGKLDGTYRPGSSFTITAIGPAGWLSSRVFTATLGGTALSVSEDGDDLIVTASKATTAAHPRGTQDLVITQTGGNAEIVGRWVPRTDGSTHENTEATVVIDDLNVAVSILGVEVGSGGGGAPADAAYLVATANGDLSDEVVVGATPGGELGGTWASPTVDATHSGSSHAGVQAAAEATAAAALSAHEADTTNVHGITNTAALETTTGSQAKADAAEAAANGYTDSEIAALSATYVALAGDQTVAGVKTFSSAPVVPADVYDSSWNGLQEPAPKDALYDALGDITAAGKAVLTAANAGAQRTALGLVIGTDVQAQSADLNDLISRWVPASASGPASLDFLEDTDNGSHKATVAAPAALAGDVALTLPSTSGTLALAGAGGATVVAGQDAGPVITDATPITTETRLLDATLTVPACAAGDLVRVTAFGTLTQNSGGSRTLTWRVKLGSTTVASMGFGISSSASARRWMVRAYCRVEATNNQDWSADLGVVNQMLVDGGSSAEDLSSSKQLDLTIQGNSTGATQSYQLLGITVERVPS